MTKDQLRKIMSNLREGRLNLYCPHLTTAMEQYEINTPLREAAFLAQIGHESADLLYMEELASGAAYEGRIDLGNVKPGDGKRYKGRGVLQLTGRSNYQKYGDLLGVDLISLPELAAVPEYSFKVAGLYWQLHRLNALADNEDIKRITKKINGGYNGLEDRIRRYELAKSVLMGDSA